MLKSIIVITIVIIIVIITIVIVIIIVIIIVTHLLLINLTNNWCTKDNIKDKDKKIKIFLKEYNYLFNMILTNKVIYNHKLSYNNLTSMKKNMSDLLSNK